MGFALVDDLLTRLTGRGVVHGGHSLADAGLDPEVGGGDPRVLETVAAHQPHEAGGVGDGLVGVGDEDATIEITLNAHTVAAVLESGTSRPWCFSALLGMLNSCSPGLAVVNIDNGFGAGYLASVILRSAGDGGQRLPIPAPD